ncbi:MAG TPA: double-strand break repair helicase AddA [Roseococcus sp.]|jgi:ATP-dependent helicase/nuclease subunit A|nr:double-strand break repair helicase AddA [Roseococcus sp.]
MSAPPHAPHDARAEANARQRAASDPLASCFVTASAGSGKTKLLTDRLLRLMLGGAPPERLLCLTFTKAAAAEMASRLNARLGGWAVADAPALRAELTELLGRPPGQDETERARDAFARVLELPGGMRIATLHAFAQSLLRGFPLEAGLAPGFAVMEEMDAAARMAEAREVELPVSPATGHLATLTDARGMQALLRALRDEEAALEGAITAAGGTLAGLRKRLAARLGLAPDADMEALGLEAAAGGDDGALSRAAAALLLSGNGNDVTRGEDIRAFLTLGPAARLVKLADWMAVFLTKDGTVRKSFATKGCGAAQAMIQATLATEGERLLDIETRRQALALLDATMAALTLGRPVLGHFAAAKRRVGRLDYDDLIASARALLNDPGAAWVLYKLDGGLDHVLLDEAQDSNPEQWGIAGALTAEFTTGEGSNAAPRTLFAVGDVKQSIFGFQGADAAGLPREATRFEARAAAAGQAFRRVELNVSFRSAPPVLALVDAVFADGAARQGVVGEGETLRHNPDRAGMAGCVEIWPLLAAGDAEEAPEWEVPETPMGETGPDARLAQVLARRIRHMLDHERLPARHEGDPEQGEAEGGRRIRAGDILVLVRKRDAFLAQLVRALKELDVPVGGVDRMVLVEQLAVLDVLATLDAILLPEDDLQLAAALKSPIFGLEEGDLFALAHGRTGSLHARLMARRGEENAMGRAADLFAELSVRADHLPPHALIAEILSERGGRARLLARLGPDAADPLDELLTAALAHERAHPASLQHFLHWLRRAATEVKREPENSADRVRVMTVHGAKGLQAPIVILPDTASAPPARAGLRWTEDDLPLWAPRAKGFAATPWTDAQSAETAREAEEANRLLYVALTRAEDRLLVCGWYRKKKAAACWHDKVVEGFRRLEGVEEVPFDPVAWGAEAAGFLDGPMLRLETPQEGPRKPERPADSAAAAPPLPAWARSLAPEVEGLRVATPSHMEDEEVEGAAAAPHAPGDPLGTRFRRGNLIHALLQSLPELPERQREAAAARYLARPGHGLDVAQQAEILAEALGVLAHPDIAAAFGPGSLAEAPIAGRIGARLILGVVDRLLVTPDAVLILDFKTNRPPPLVPGAAPAGYLRQMAAYRAVLRLAYPGREVTCALVWTYGARVMPLPSALLDTHAPTA